MRIETRYSIREFNSNSPVFYFHFVGNVGNVFAVDSTLGIVSVSKMLQRDVQADYDVVVRAVDGGSPSLTSTVHVFITVTVSDNAPPKFEVKVKSSQIKIASQLV